MQKITPCLWFDNQAEEAAQFYTSIFNNSKIVQRSALIVVFELEGRSFMALNGGPVFKFTPAISLSVNCETQDEVDRLWEKLSADKSAEQCGWLKDKYGLSWQIVPEALGKMPHRRWDGTRDHARGHEERHLEAPALDAAAQ